MKNLIAMIVCVMTTGVSIAAPVVNLSATVNSRRAPVTPTLTWSSTGANVCTASSIPVDANWNGTVGLSGTKTVGPIIYSTTYSLKCSTSTDSTATLSWQPPYINSDGSQLTDLAGFRIYEVLTSGNVLRSTIDSQYNSIQITNLGAGVHTFYATAYNSTGTESIPSSQGSKTIVSTSSATKSVGVTVKR